MEFYEYIERFMRSFGGSDCLRLEHCLKSLLLHPMVGQKEALRLQWDAATEENDALEMVAF